MTSSESDEAIYPNTETGFLVRPNKNILFPLYSQLVLLIPSLETSVLRQRIHNLPLIQLDHLISLDHIKEAFLLLSFLGSSYVWGQYPHDQVDHVLPINISLAWTYVSHQLGLYPVISYAAVTFYNLVDITHLDTLKVKYLFTGLRDEEWFYLVSVAIELAGKNIISVVHELLTGTINLPTQLQILKECIEEFIRLLR